MNYKDLRVLLLKRFHMPKERSVRFTMRSFTIAEKAVFYIFVTVFIVSGFVLLWRVSSTYLIEVPIRGGTLTEGVVGNPRFINPVLAISEADKNLTTLIYSGLVRISPEGQIENDLAREVTISSNRLTYTVSIDENAKFHDGEPVTADDVLFTISKITDPIIKSPRRGSWDGVIVEKIDEETLTFTLKQPYTPFVYNLTLGILPKHIWKNVSDDEFSFTQFNTLPIGSGPFEVDKVERNTGGIPNYYRLTPAPSSQGQTPFIKNLVFRFYTSELALIDAYNGREIESVSGISPEKLRDLDTRGSRIIASPLPRVFGVFFNQSKSKVLLNKEVRQALELASPKKEIVENVLGGHATVINGPLPAGIYEWTSGGREELTADIRIEKAREILTKAGWQLNSETGVLEKKSKTSTIDLSFTLSTGDAPELRQVADELAASWQKLGAKVEVLVFETGELNQSVIRPRNFDALLFGEVVGRDVDPYPFWHSSQRSDPGLNIALYANSRADSYLEDARRSGDAGEIEKNLKSFSEELEADVPAAFLYTPSFLYVIPEKVKAVNLGTLSTPQDRFLGVRNWYIETDNVWKIFIK